MLYCSTSYEGRDKWVGERHKASFSWLQIMRRTGVMVPFDLVKRALKARRT